MVGAGTTPAYLTNILALGLQAPVQLVMGKGRHRLHFHGFSWIRIFCVGASCGSWLSRREECFCLSVTDKFCPLPAAFSIVTAASGSGVAERAGSLGVLHWDRSGGPGTPKPSLILLGSTFFYGLPALLDAWLSFLLAESLSSVSLGN